MCNCYFDSYIAAKVDPTKHICINMYNKLVIV